MKKIPCVGSFKLGDKVSFIHDDSVMTGIITEITRLHVIIKPIDNPRYYDDYRVTIPRLDVVRNRIDMKHYINPEENDDGTFTI